MNYETIKLKIKSINTTIVPNDKKENSLVFFIKSEKNELFYYISPGIKNSSIDYVTQKLGSSSAGEEISLDCVKKHNAQNEKTYAIMFVSKEDSVEEDLLKNFLKK